MMIRLIYWIIFNQYNPIFVILLGYWVGWDNTINRMNGNWSYEPLNPEFRTPGKGTGSHQKPMYNSMMPQEFARSAGGSQSLQDKKLMK